MVAFFVMCYAYILYSTLLDTYYIGSTCDILEERLRRHNSHHKGFTGKSQDWIIVFSLPFSTKTAAIQQEMVWKLWKSRKKIEALVNGK